MVKILIISPLKKSVIDGSLRMRVTQMYGIKPHRPFQSERAQKYLIY